MELLVVVAILGILMSLLTPGLVGLLNKAKLVQCSTNIKHLGMGVFHYSDDYNDFYPNTAWDPEYKGAYSIYYRSNRSPQSIHANPGGHMPTPHFTYTNLFPYYGGEDQYFDVNTCPFSPERAPFNGFRRKLSSYNAYYWIAYPTGQWEIRSGMLKVGDRWQGDRRWQPNYMWYNVVLSDVYSISGTYGGSGPVATHPPEDGVHGSWKRFQGMNGYESVYGPTTLNSMTDDGAVILLEDVYNDSTLPHVGGYNTGAVPKENGIENL